jgi:hypothetical protein
MRNNGRAIEFDQAEMEEFGPSWNELVRDDDFVRETSRLRNLLLLADEEGIMNGSSPLLPDLERYAAHIDDRVSRCRPDWSGEKHRVFRFFCLYHPDEGNRFDVDAGARIALEKKNAGF